MTEHSIMINGIIYDRITKTKARNLFIKGYEIYYLPCKCNPLSNWYSCFVNHPLNHIDNAGAERDFNTWHNIYTYYNCNQETGKYVAFYAKESSIRAYNLDKKFSR